MSATILCPRCYKQGGGEGKRQSSINVDCQNEARLTGIIKCLVCGHEVPIIVENGFIQKLDIEVAGGQADKLNSSIATDILDDLREAERNYHNQCFKSCVTMCRRALQLGLIDKGIEDKPFSVMLSKARTNEILTDNTYNLATSIKHFGDIGAHRREELDSDETRLVIYATVRMLNELFIDSKLSEN